MTDLGQPRHITAGRPLPPRKAPPIGPGANDLPLQSVVSAAPTPVPTGEATQLPVMAAERGRLSRPDPRPMRFAFGAAAVAAVSFLAVGFGQPDFGSSAEQPTDTEALAANAAADSTGTAGQQTVTRDQRITRYVFLAPGEKAPPGATVISPEDTRVQPGRETSQSAAPAAEPITPAAQPEPAAPPRVTTRQSGG